jgi:hypothetical protein
MFKKPDAFAHTFWNAENRRKRGKKTAFLFKKVGVPFRGQSVKIMAQ